MSEDEKRMVAASDPDRAGVPVKGPVSLFADDTLDFPLWGRGSPIEGGRNWLHKELGISFGLIDDLFRLMDQYYDDGTNMVEEEAALWQRLQTELKPHLRMPDPPVRGATYGFKLGGVFILGVRNAPET